MSKYHSLSHTSYNIGYHVVFSPKYRYRLLRGASAAMLKELLLEEASNLGIAIQAMEVMPDHVHLFVVTNPNMNIGTIVKSSPIFGNIRACGPAHTSRNPSDIYRKKTVVKYIASQKSKTLSSPD